jgi:hypothetical protein
MKSMFVNLAVCIATNFLLPCLEKGSLCSFNLSGRSFSSFITCELRQLTLVLKIQEAQRFFSLASFKVPLLSSIFAVKT